MRKFLPVCIFVAALLGIGYVQGPVKPVVQQQQKQVAPKPRLPAITTQIPGYLPYADIVKQIKTWNEQAQDFTQVGTYGKSTQGADLYYIRVTNKLTNQPKKRVLITACIHGNEPLATATVMGYIGTLLHDADKNKELLDTRDIYFIPVVNPDSYPHSRHVDGVDPNRDFPGPRDPNHRSVASVKALAEFFVAGEFDAVISGHTFGRVFLTPYGDTTKRCPHEAEFQRIVGKMCEMSGYRQEHCCEMYSRPIFGTEVDFYYRHGAFAIVLEFGTHQRIPTNRDIETEFNKTYGCVLYFLKEAPLVNIKGTPKPLLPGTYKPEINR